MANFCIDSENYRLEVHRNSLFLYKLFILSKKGKFFQIKSPVLQKTRLPIQEIFFTFSLILAPSDG